MNKLLLLTVCWLLVGCGSLESRAAEWQDLDKWVGKHPVDVVDGRETSILRDERLKPLLESLLSKADLALLEEHAVTTPVRSSDGYLVVNLCRPRQCPADMSMIVIDAKAPKIWVGFFERREKKVMTRWFGNEDNYSVLPEAIRTGFLKRHGG